MQMSIVRLLTPIVLATLCFFGVAFTSYAHNGIDHSAPQDVQLKQELRLLLLKKLVLLLQAKQKMQQSASPSVVAPAAPAAPSEDHEHEEGHEHEEEHDTVSVHIMKDGKIMGSDGKVLTDATITADGKVKFANGTIVEPEFDLR